MSTPQHQVLDYHEGAEALSTLVGSLPGSWLAAYMADFTPVLQFLCCEARQYIASTLYDLSPSAIYRILLAFQLMVVNTWLHCWTVPHGHTSEVISPSGYGRGLWDPATTAHLSAHWPHLLAWCCRSVWSWPYQCAVMDVSLAWSGPKSHCHVA